MFSLIVFIVCVGMSGGQLPHGHELHELIDSGFRYLDTNHDGILSIDELAAVAAQEDINQDGFVSLDEYMQFTKQSIEVAKPMFDAYDIDGDGLLPTNHLMEYLHILDNNHDGQVTMKEYEHYMTQFVQCVYGEHGHGHATHGHAATCF